MAYRLFVFDLNTIKYFLSSITIYLSHFFFFKFCGFLKYHVLRIKIHFTYKKNKFYTEIPE